MTGPGPVAFVLKGYPRLSETFIAQEIRALEARGLRIVIVSLRHPTDAGTHPVHDEIAAPVRYLPEYLHREPLRVARAWRYARRLPGFRRARAAWRRDVARDRTRNRVRRFGQAMVLAAELNGRVAHLHAHFLHTPASVARYAAMLLGLPWTCSAHAKDIWTSPEWELREKLADLDWLVTCTGYAARHLAALSSRPETVECVYHGLDLARFPIPPGKPPPGVDRPVGLLSVGRAVEKKGYDDLLRALALLPVDLDWRLVHIGGGARARLRRRAEGLGLAARIDWRGPQRQDAVLRAYREADVFVLPSRIARDGDRDGLPNVLMEAQSQALPCLSTRVSAIPELIIDGETGVLVEPEAPEQLAAALERLLREPARRQQLGAAGRARVQRHFSHEPGIDRLAEKFGLSVPAVPAATACGSPSTLP